MRFSELSDALSLRHIAGPVPQDFDGVYAGDFLSRAMSRLHAGQLWITVMNNVNVIAVASLEETAAVLLAENETLMPEAAAAAQKQGIAVYSSPDSVYTLCAKIASLTAERA